MLQQLKNLIYFLLVDSGILFHVFPLLKPLILRFKKPIQTSNYQSLDDGGVPIHLTKYNGKLFPPAGEAKLASIKDLRIRDSDVIICGYPKTGLHWVYEVVYMIRNKTPTISKYGNGLGGMLDMVPTFILDSVPSPRILNSHLLYDELPTGIKTKKTKIIFDVRAPKDTIVSFYNHHKSLDNVYGYKGLFENYFSLFMNGGLDYGTYFDFMLDWDKVVSSPDFANDFFIVRFEEHKRDPEAMVKKLAAFLEVDISDEFAHAIAQASNFSNMKKVRSKDPSEDMFYRKGTVGDWKNWLTDKQGEEIDKKWTETMAKCKVLGDE